MPQEHEEKDDLRSTLTALIETPPESVENEDQAAPAAEEQPAPAEEQLTPRTPAKQVSENQEPAAQEQPAQVAPTEIAPLERAPVAWKPLAREKWAGVDPEIKAEVMRREREIDNTLRTTAEDRRTAEELRRTLAPYEHMLRAEGATPLQAIQNFFQTAANLRTAQPAQRATLIADLINNFGIDVQLLDQVLTQRMGGAGAAQQSQSAYAPIMQQLDQKLAPLQQFVSQFQQAQQHSQQRQQEEVAQTLQQFMSDPANEFAQDVAGDMADILDLAARRGQVMTLQDAYSRATMLHPQIAQIMSQRKLAEAASQQTQSAQRARQASASVQNGGAPSQDASDDNVSDIRSALGASIRQLSR